MQRKTKIVATIGPASRTPEMLGNLLQAGVNVIRLNFSHGTPEENRDLIKLVREVSAGIRIPTAVLLDLPGVKLRTGSVKGQRVFLKPGSAFSLIRENIPGDETRVFVNLPPFRDGLNAGDNIFLNDGAIQLRVVAVSEAEIKCEVITGGWLTERRGVNIPSIRFNLPSLTERDREIIKLGIEEKIDWIAVSFVRSAKDIIAARSLLRENGSDIALIAKIEKHEALKDIDSIIEKSDGIMVARGDLGAEIFLQEVPVVQKQIVAKCRAAGKPVIVATQMLESMINAPRPTRAEVNDVANAIYDGTDAVMLSGETAVGQYPVEAVEMMAGIALETEKAITYRLPDEEESMASSDDAISFAACHIAQKLSAACIVAFTTSGSTALRVSRYRPEAPILALTPDEGIAQRLLLSWGVTPLTAPRPGNLDNLLEMAARLAVETGLARKNNSIVITAGIPMGVPGSTNLIKLLRI